MAKIPASILRSETVEMTACTLALTNQGAELYKSENNTYQIITDTGSIIANVTSIVKLLKPISISSNMLASTLVFSKMQGDLMTGKSLKKGDVLTLTSHLTGIIGTVIVQSTLKANPRVISVIIITTAVASVFSEKTLGIATNIMKNIFNNNFSQRPLVPTPNLYLGCKSELIAFNDICPQRPALGFTISDNQCKLDQVIDWYRLDPPESDGDGDGS